MKNNHTQLTRTCASCGISKPLAAFLHISPTQGTFYGTICSDCRGIESRAKSTDTQSEDERSSTASGVRIGTKEKVRIEKEQKRTLEEQKNAETKETKKRGQSVFEKLERTGQHEKTEKERREDYLEGRQKQSFLNYQSKKPPGSQQSIESAKQISDEKHQSSESTKKEAAVQHEKKITTVDLNSPLTNINLSENRFQGSVIREFIKKLPGNAPARIAIEKTSAKPAEKDQINELIDKTWGPSSRKR